MGLTGQVQCNRHMYQGPRVAKGQAPNSGHVKQLQAFLLMSIWQKNLFLNSPTHCVLPIILNILKHFFILSGLKKLILKTGGSQIQRWYPSPLTPNPNAKHLWQRSNQAQLRGIAPLDLLPGLPRLPPLLCESRLFLVMSRSLFWIKLEMYRKHRGLFAYDQGNFCYMWYSFSASCFPVLMEMSTLAPLSLQWGCEDSATCPAQVLGFVAWVS